MAYVFVKESFDKDITGEKRGDTTLTFGENAFSTIADAYSSDIDWNQPDEAYTWETTLVLLDNKVELKKNIAYPDAEKLHITSDETGKSRGTLKVTADISGGKDRMVLFSNFSNVELTNARAHDFLMHQTKTVGLDSYVAGKITVGENSHVNDIINYKTVNIAGKNTRVKNVIADQWTIKEEDDQPVARQNTAVGSVKVAAGAKVLGNISSYSSVSVSDAEVVDNITGTINNLQVNAMFDQENGFTGYELLLRQADAFSSVAFSDKVKFEELSASGSAAVKQTAKDSGSVKVENSMIGGTISNFTNVTVRDDSTVKGLERFVQRTENEKKSYSAGKNDLTTLTHTVQKNVTFNGSATVEDSNIEYKNANYKIVAGDITGFNTVKLTNSSAGDISLTANGSLLKQSSSKIVYQAADAEYFKQKDFTNDPSVTVVSTQTSAKYAASGSVTVKLDKDAAGYYVVNDITGYKNVKIAGYEDKDGTVNYLAVFGNIDKSLDSVATIANTIVKGVDEKGNITLEGKEISKSSYTASGSLNMSNAVSGIFNGYSSVKLDNYGYLNDYYTSFSDNGISSKNDYTKEYSTDENGVITEKYKHKTTYKAIGSLTAKNSFVSSINNFASIKLTNSTVGSIINQAYNKTLLSTEQTAQWENYEQYGKGNYQNAESFTSKTTSEHKSTGKVDIKLDKEFDAETDYTVGAIGGYLNVNIAGYDKDNLNKVITVTGDITGGSTSSTVVERNNLRSDTMESVSVGKLALDNVKVSGSISDFANITLKETLVKGDITGGKSIMYKSDAGDSYEIVRNESIGSLTLENVQTSGSVTGFKTINAKSGLNYLNSVDGKADTQEKIIVAKNTVLAVCSLSLQRDDTLTVNGELVLSNYGNNSAWNSELKKINGKGIVYANSTTISQIRGIVANSDVESKNLGNTSMNFGGAAIENKDHSAATANIWDVLDENFSGWLGFNTAEDNVLDFQDQVDYIKVVAGYDAEIKISSSAWTNGTTDTVFAGAQELTIEDGACTFEVTAGEEYIICITRNDSNSMSYTMTASEIW